MESRHAAATQQFIKELNLLRLEAGNPSLGLLAHLSGRMLVKTTLDDHLSGRRARLPSWQLVSAYVSACHRAAASTGLSVENLGSVPDWYARYKAAMEGDSEAPCPVQLQPSETNEISSQTGSFEKLSKQFR